MEIDKIQNWSIDRLRAVFAVKILGWQWFRRRNKDTKEKGRCVLYPPAPRIRWNYSEDSYEPLSSIWPDKSEQFDDGLNYLFEQNPNPQTDECMDEWAHTPTFLRHENWSKIPRKDAAIGTNIWRVISTMKSIGYKSQVEIREKDNYARFWMPTEQFRDGSFIHEDAERAVIIAALMAVVHA